ncbi:MAG TPA: hypothetical protein VFJ19_15985 [Nocardioidaceae bacterium]|nr:hypothetical protein [Nocardioidaceae bacterium]
MRTNFESSGSFIGIGGLVVALFLYGYAAIALPSLLHTLAMPLFWLVLFVLGCRRFGRHPYRSLVLAVAAFAVWFALMLGLGPTA